MGYRIGICDKDKTYAMGLMEHFNGKSTAGIKAKAFTSVSNLKEYITVRNLDLVLMNRENSSEEWNFPVLYISEEADMPYGGNYIYKYQSMPNIVKTVEELLNKRTNDTIKETDICAVFSPLGRCGKTTFAKGIAYHYGRSLYLGFEEYMTGMDSVWREEFAYYLAEKNPLILELIEELIPDEKECRYVQIADSYMDIRCIGREHVEWFIKELKQSARYNTVVFDIGQATFDSLDVMQAFEKIYVPILEETNATYKVENFKNIVARCGRADLLNRFKYLQIPWVDYRDIVDVMEEAG